MGDDPMNDIKITSPSPLRNHYKHLPTVTIQDMSTSLKNLSPYLQPQPTKHDISTSTTIDYRKFSIPDEFIQPFMIDVVIKPGVLNLEMMLLAVEAIGRSSAKFMKAMFRTIKKENPPMLLGGYVVFKKWLCFLFDRLEDQFQNGDHDSKYISSDGPQMIEEMIASSILDLICKFSVIKDLKQIGLLKSKFRVDWFTIVEKSIKFGSAYELSGLIESSKNAHNHLNTIKTGTSVGSATTSPSSLEKRVSHTPLTSDKNNDTSYPPSKTNRSKAKNWTPPKFATSTSPSSPSSSLASSNVASVSAKAISSTNDSINHRNPHLKDAKNWIPPQTEQSNAASGGTSPKWIPPKITSSNAHTTASTAPAASSSQQRMARLLEDAKRKHDPTSQPPPQLQQQGAASNRSSQPQKKNNTDNIKPSSTGGDGSWGAAAPSSTAEKSSASSWGKSTSDKSSGDGGWGSASVNKSTGWDASANALPDKNVTCNNSSGGWGSSRSGGDAGSSGWNADKSNNNDKKSSLQQQSSTGSNNGQSAWSGNGSKKSDERMTRNPSSSSVINEQQQKQSSASNSHRNEFGNNAGVDGSSNIGRKADRTISLVDNLSEDGEINDPQSRSMHLKRNSDVSSSNNKREFRYRDLEDSAPYPIKKTCYDKSSAPRAVSMGTNGGSSYGRDSNHASSSGGMGRGREATIPAWMSRMESASADGGKVRGTNTSTREETLHNRSQNYSSLGNERAPRGDTSSSANGGGRGRERTQPAWMTKQHANNANSSAVEGGTKNQRESTVVRQVSSNEMKGGPMSGGRGRERTMPSWMTKNPNNTNTAVNGLSNRELDRNTPEKTRQMDMNTSTSGARSPGMIRQPPQNADHGSSRQISNTSSSNGTASAGRGRGMTAPAWMTRKSNNNDNDTTMDPRRDSKSHEGDGEKGAVGRGRRMTEPAWMTRNSNTDHGSSTENQRNAATNKPSRQVTDTLPVGPQSIGRGREATTPAWMTQKRTNGNNASAESQRNPISTGANREPRSADNGILDRRHNANVPERSTHHAAASGRPLGTPGIGRGRGATTPAWMTKKGNSAEQGSTDNTRSRSDVVPQRQVSVEESGGRSNANRERERPTPNNDDVRRGSQDFANAGRNNSMGRGHDQTLPAWMTKDGATSSPTKSVSEGNRRDGHARDNRDYQSRSDSRTGSASRSYSDQAYNSRQDTGRNSHNGHTTQSRGGGQDSGGRGYRDHDSHASNFSTDRGAGRSLGRGKDINRPAWMSKN